MYLQKTKPLSNIISLKSLLNAIWQENSCSALKKVSMYNLHFLQNKNIMLTCLFVISLEDIRK